MVDAQKSTTIVGTSDMRTFRFASFDLDTATRQLLRDGREVSLSPKAFQLLLLLVANRDRAISKQELHQSFEDLGGKNGTYVAGERVTVARRLDDGDQIRLGSVVVKFRIPSLSAAPKRPRDDRLRFGLVDAVGPPSPLKPDPNPNVTPAAMVRPRCAPLLPAAVPTHNA